ncbi:hypothetical protein FHW36_104323 [Chitinophaga polysaccharea]|uniref:Uncharacterized protein n=1 Tax=Chitinophaga polysaccharea TaxID=1293035 RepID=A0A561PRA7_9BACT|nr:hypothetical protein FHW36_104323 [Chitinophaga polysaccharea]
MCVFDTVIVRLQAFMQTLPISRERCIYKLVKMQQVTSKISEVL